MSKKPEISSVCCTLYICNKILIRSSCRHIAYAVILNSIPCSLQTKYKSNRNFSCNVPRLTLSFLPPLSYEIFTADFSSRIFIFTPVHWQKKSDYSNLAKPSRKLGNKLEAKLSHIFNFLKNLRSLYNVILVKWIEINTISEWYLINIFHYIPYWL